MRFIVELMMVHMACANLIFEQLGNALNGRSNAKEVFIFDFKFNDDSLI